MKTIFFNFFVLLFIISSKNLVSDDYWEKLNSPYCATVYSLAESNNGDMYAGVRDGIYKSTDLGISWKRVFKVDKDNSSILIDREGIIYAGFDQCFFRSTDNGQTWDSLMTFVHSPFEVTSIVMNSKNEIFVALSGTGIYKTTDKGNSWIKLTNGLGSYKPEMLGINKNDIIFACSPELFISTDDGESWERQYGFYYDVNAFAFNSKDEIFAVYSGPNSILRSTNNGKNWERLTSGIDLNKIDGVNSISINQSDEIFIGTYGKSSNSPSNLYMGPKGNGVYKSMDNGLSWFEVNQGLESKNINCLISTKNGILFVGTNNSGVYRCTDNGINWIQVNNGIDDIDINEFDFDKNDNLYARNTLYGIFKSIDTGISWRQTVNGLDGINAYTLSISNLNSLLVSTFKGGIYKSTNSGISWEQSNQGLNGDMILSLESNKPGYIFGGLNIGGLFRSSDDGNNWERISNSLDLTMASFIKTFNNGYVLINNLYNDSICKSTDNGSTWKKANSGLKDIMAKALSDNIENTLFMAGLSWDGFDTYLINRGLFISYNFGDDWEHLPSIFDSIGVLSFVIGKNNIIYAGSGNGVYSSSNLGNTWEKLPGLDSQSVSQLKINNSGYLFVLSNHKIYKFKQIVGAVNTDINQQFIVFPNPIFSTFNIKFTNNISSSVSIELYDILGNKIYTKNLGFLESGMQTTTINLKEDINPGCYLVVVRSGADIQSIKVVKS
ncbi:MAG: T9SS type A sorting domain-containing protein, partial [Bacteroidetes bacterium]